MIVKALVSYDGFNYAGWQKQENALGIQQVIEEALYKITKEKVDVVASGRTDAGVHAFGQVFHFETNKNIPAIQYERALNALLPKDIRILKTEEMPDDFHARFSAVGKRYDYYCSYDIKNPFNYKYRNLLTKKLDIEAMKMHQKYSWDLMILRVLPQVKSIRENLESKRFQILKLLKRVWMCILSLRVQVF